MICYEYVKKYIRNTIKKNDGLLREIEKYAKKNHIPIISPEVTQLIRILGKLQRPKKILEIGTAIGYSALILSETLQNGGTIDTIEKEEEMILMAKENIKKANKEKNINVIAGEAADVLKNLDKEYDLIFLDAAKGQYLEFLKDCLRLLKVGGILISDNVLYKGMVASDEMLEHKKKSLVLKMREYLEKICNDSNLETVILSDSDGVALSFKKGNYNEKS